MTPVNYLPSLNFGDLYCSLSSIFGSACAALPADEASTAALQASVATTPISLWGILGGGFSAIGAFIFGVFSVVWALYSAIAYTISGLLILFIFGSLMGILYIRYKEMSLYSTLPAETRTIHPLKSGWEALLEDAISNDPKRWRRGVAEADKIFGELLAKLGYQGQGTAERLRSVPDGAFVTLPAAWEAHRVKNFVMSRHSNYILTQREAFRVMKLYEQVFEEFDFI